MPPDLDDYGERRFIAAFTLSWLVIVALGAWASGGLGKSCTGPFRFELICTTVKDKMHADSTMVAPSTAAPAHALHTLARPHRDHRNHFVAVQPCITNHVGDLAVAGSVTKNRRQCDLPPAPSRASSVNRRIGNQRKEPGTDGEQYHLYRPVAPRLGRH
jgi:hypothetical protein